MNAYSMTVEATCLCGWAKHEANVIPPDRVIVQRILEWDAHVHELRHARRAYAHDTTVVVKAA